MSIRRTHEWFLAAVTPSKPLQKIQTGVHIEECTELLDNIVLEANQNLVDDANRAMKALAKFLKEDKVDPLTFRDRKEVLDSLVDQIVTATGVGYSLGMDVPGGLDEINDSNYSKFVDGKAIFDVNGKIAKGPNYRKANLTEYVGIDNT